LIALTILTFSCSLLTLLRRRADNLRASFGIRRWKTSGLAFVDGFRVLSVIVATCGIIYFFKNPLYIPDVLAKEAFFALGGCAIFMATRKSTNARHVFYILSLSLSSQLLLAFHRRAGNAYNFHGSQDLFFPFQYIHGWSTWPRRDLPWVTW